MADGPITSIFDEGKREIFLITTSDDSRPSGMIITWVTSASLIPDDKRIVLVLSPHNHTTQMLTVFCGCSVYDVGFGLDPLADDVATHRTRNDTHMRISVYAFNLPSIRQRVE
jgi:hypothetical protein